MPSHVAKPKQMVGTSAPAGTGVQKPCLPGMPHEMHALPASLHTLSQQDPSTQGPFAQSLPFVQIFPWTHGAQSGPPQSTSVSFPSCIPSWHVPASAPPPVPVPVELLVELLLLELLLAPPVLVPVELLLAAPVPVELLLAPLPPWPLLLVLLLAPPAPPALPHVTRSPQSDDR